MTRRLVTPIDSECLTARILADHLRDMIDRADSSPEHVAACLGKEGDTVRAWCKGRNIASAIAVLNAFEVLGCRVVIAPPRGNSR